MNALVLAPFASESLTRLRRRMSVAYEPWTETRRLWDPAELAARLIAEEIEAVVVEADFLFDEVFAPPSPLRFAGVCRGAANHVDMDAAAAYDVTVVMTPGRNANAVAELTIGLALALARRIPTANAYVHSGAWQDPIDPYVEMRGIELAGRTMGVVGLGEIGRRVARLARAMGMRVLGYDPFAAPLRGVRAASLDDLFAASDVVTLHAPETADTVGMVDARRLALMPAGALLINTTSAALIDEAALADALRSGRLAGAGLDVFATHPIMPNSPLLTLGNVVLTPHLGGATAETIRRYSRTITRELLAFARQDRGRGGGAPSSP